MRERCGLFWGVTGRTMLRDEAHAFLQAGAAIESADMVLRMLRVALPLTAARAPRRTCATARRSRCCRPSAASRPTGARVPAPPNAGPVARFLLFERDYPDSVAFSIEALHNALTAADPSYRSSPAVLRLSRMIADLDFRARAAAIDGGLGGHARGRPARARRSSIPTSPAATLATPAQPVARPAAA